MLLAVLYLTLNNLNQTGSSGLARQCTLSRILTGDISSRTSAHFTMPPRKLILDTRHTLTSYVISSTIFVTTLPDPTPLVSLIAMCIRFTVVHKSWIVMKLGAGGHVYRLLAALADVFVVGGGDLLGLVASQLDAPSQLACDGGLVATLSQQRVYSLDLVPTLFSSNLR